jgi:hypothetical protein
MSSKASASASSDVLGGGTETLAALQTTLTILKDSLSGVPVPGFQASVAGLLALLTAIRVSDYTITCCYLC